MRAVSTVYLSEPVAPRGGSHHSGYVTRHDERGIWIEDREDGRGGQVFFPTHLLLRVEHNTGWR
ncbi:hypothetical protein MKI84_08570 [Ancylobacter sp. A5.8]|uniref:hypothetical protein n=1 Tax=Ancylobacter gelatini TaxID=2919920 RepID=UPI001F4E40C7|nr:hypothetical protein [Ancylobacter gelatini]MCJ8142969.1 hypothetical protein [Ancylobacter gelatini]